MGISQIIDLVKQLTYIEQLTIAETILRSILEQEKGNPSPYDTEETLALAAEALYEDYANNEDLTIFTQLDGETFHEER